MAKQKELQAAFLKHIQDFIDNRNRSKFHMWEIEGYLAQLYGEDERFDGLQYALSMYGAGNSEEDEKWLLAEFQYAIGRMKEDQLEE